MLWRQGNLAGIRELGVHVQRPRPAPERHRTSPAGRAAYGYDDAARLTSETITGDAARRHLQRRDHLRPRSGAATGCRARRRCLPSPRRVHAYDANDQLDERRLRPERQHDQLRRQHVRLRLREPPRLEGRRRRHDRLRLRRQPRRQDRRRRDDAVPRRRPEPDGLPAGARGGRRRRRADAVHVRRRASSARRATSAGHLRRATTATTPTATSRFSPTRRARSPIRTTTTRGGSWSRAPGSTPNTRLYAGEEFDPDLGLINLRARYYSMSSGRFLTGNPVSGSRLGPIQPHRYVYADSEPVRRIRSSWTDGY